MFNVILVSVDSLRADVVNPENTPNLCQLGRQGCQFDTTIVQAPFTVTSHASMLTGLYPFNHQLRKFGGQKLGKNAQTILHYLASQNYVVSALLDVNVLSHEQGFTDGFQDRNRSTNMSDIRQFVTTNKKAPFFLFLHYWGVHTPYHTYISVESGRDLIGNLDVFLKETLDWSPIQLKPDQPYWLKRVNKVRQLLLGDRQDTVWRGYLKAVKHMDHWLGQLLKLLGENSLQKNTVLIVTADHGECFNEHGEAYLKPESYEHGTFLYDNTVRVQTIFAGPTIPENKLISAQIESVDIVPTIYDLLGLTPIGDSDFLHLDGVSVRPLWSSEQPGKEQTYSETQKDDLNQVMLRTPSYKLIHDKVLGEKKLFDLRTDPNEQHDLAQKALTICQQMEIELDRFLATRQQNTNNTHSMTESEITTVTARLQQLGYLD